GYDYFRTLTIKDENGKDAPMTHFGKSCKEQMDLKKLASRTLEPGQQVKATLNLGLAFDLTRPGTYTINVKAPFIDQLGDGVVANEVQVKITPPIYPITETQDWLLTKIGDRSRDPADDVGPSWNVKNLDKRIKEVAGKAVLDVIGEDSISAIMI